MTSRSGALGDGIRLALGTLTVLPTGRIGSVDRRVGSIAMIIAPLAVLPLALLAGAVGGLGALAGLPSVITALLVLAALTLGSRALHLDGLADTVDGLGVSWDRERSWAVMRAGDVGPMGVVALILVLGLQVAGLAWVLERPWAPVEITMIICASRGALTLACARGIPAARRDGLGAAVADSVPRWAVALVWLMITVGLIAVRLLPGSGQLWMVAVQVCVALVVLVVLLAHTRRRLGGVTGDVLGAAVELCLAALLITAVR